MSGYAGEKKYQYQKPFEKFVKKANSKSLDNRCITSSGEIHVSLCYCG